MKDRHQTTISVARTLRPLSRYLSRGLQAVVLCTLASNAIAATVEAFDQPLDFNIRQNTPLEEALIELGSRARMTVMIDTHTVENLLTTEIRGKLTPRQALTLLLKNSGLSYTEDGGVIRITRASLVRSSWVSDAPSIATENDSIQGSSTSGGTSSEGPPPGNTPSESNAGAEPRQGALSEVIVTAQKKEENILEVPVAVTAVSSESLLQNDEVRLQDYFQSIPGLNVTLDDNGRPNLSVRGLTTGGYTNPTVAVLVDDIPIGGSTQGIQGEAVPDFDPSDLARIELLRGPQGTLYGVNSFGGLLKYVTVDPSTEGFSGRVEESASSVHNGAETGYSVRGAVNIPLTDTMAVRASAYTRADPGYINDAGLYEQGINRGGSDGAHMAFSWRPSDDFYLKLSALVQHSFRDGTSAVELGTGLGDLQQDTPRSTGGFESKLQAYSATIKFKLGPIDITSLTGFSISKTDDSYGYAPSSYFTSLSESTFNADGASYTYDYQTSALSQELRLSIPLGPSFEWLVGGFYTHQVTGQYVNSIFAIDFDSGRTIAAPLVFYYITPGVFTEDSGFTTFTYHVTDRFDVQAGVRETHDIQNSNAAEFTGAYVVPFGIGTSSPSYVPTGPTFTENKLTYLVTPEYKFSHDLMVYARFATGFRPGGGPQPPNPREEPDSALNYEIGFKGSLLDNMLTIDTSLFYIDWRNIQIPLESPIDNLPYTGNGSRAKSEGIELAVEVRPTSGLTVSGWIDYDDAVLTQNFPPGPDYGAAGDRLPDSSRISSNIAADESFPLPGNVSGFVGFTTSYVGNRIGIFQPIVPGETSPPLRQFFPGYAKTDLRLGAKFNSWTVTGFVTNTFDRRAIIGGGLDAFDPNAFQIITPRTIGISASKTF